MFKQHCMITIPTDLVIRDLVSQTHQYCQEKGLVNFKPLDLYDASRIVVNAIYDVLYSRSPFISSRDTAEELLREILPWYNDPMHSTYFYPNIFDALFQSTEQLLNELVDKNAYDVWDVRVTRNLTTHIAYLGDYRILEWERQNRGATQGDVYVGDEEFPRIRGSLVAMGYYREISRNQILTDVRSITGDVVDYYGNIVLTAEDLNKGLSVK